MGEPLDERCESRVRKAEDSCAVLRSDSARMWAARYAEDVKRLLAERDALRAQLDAEQEAHRSAEWHLSEANNAYDAVKSVNDDFAREVLKLRADLDAERASYDRMFKDASQMEADLTRAREEARGLRSALENARALIVQFSKHYGQETNILPCGHVMGHLKRGCAACEAYHDAVNGVGDYEAARLALATAKGDGDGG